MILSASHISMSFGTNVLLNDATFIINEHDKVAIVGPNGCGKTTLLRILTNEIESKSGSVTLAKNTKIGYLKQINILDTTSSIHEELTKVIQPILDMESKLLQIQEQMSHNTGSLLDSLYSDYNKLQHQYELADGYSARSRVNGVIKGLGFSNEDFDKPIHTLSGGQKTRVYLAKLLLEKPDIIILDEPTNHLDLHSIEWLENYLNNYKGTVILVSHDRYFLNKIVTRVLDIDAGNLSSYDGNYTQYSEKKAMLRNAELKAYLNQQEAIKHQEAVIEKLKSFNREKSIKRAESREKMLDKIDRLEKPIEQKNDMNLMFSECKTSGQDVLSVNNISKSFDSNVLFENLSFEIKRNEHVAIIGDNGTGKTTILKIINHLCKADSGTITLGSGVKIAYYDQEHQILHLDKTLFDELQDEYPDLNNTKIRTVLAAFLFTGDDVFKKVGDLSGGERGRISLAKLMLSKANFLILDEPTNHLDLISKEILENAISKYNGTVLYVSHDRYFINQTATRILDLRNNILFNYIGNYDYYLEKKENVENAYYSQNIIDNNVDNNYSEVNISNGASDWKTAKQQQAKRAKLRRSIEKCECQINEYESQISDIDKNFEDASIQTNAAQLLKLQKDKESIELKLNLVYSEWEELLQEENENE